ncbi:MAG: alpha/beta hydrolase family protein [Chitinophagaceae bacterium]
MSPKIADRLKNRIRVIVLWCTVLCQYQVTQAATVDTVLTQSIIMHKGIKAVVITPSSYTGQTPFPVVYLLHGYGGKYSDWISKVKSLTTFSDLFGMIIVCPDGNIGSWYFDSPVDTNYKYETYVGTELPQWIDRHYTTIANRNGRAITGLSMGGHGALFLAFKHQDIFGAAGSTSGGVDIRPFPKNWEISKRLGTYSDSTARWEANSVINLTHLLTPGSLSLIIDCGSEDFFYVVNTKLHEKLLERNIPHDFIIRPGAHNWDYWSNSVGYQLLFFAKFFKTFP